MTTIELESSSNETKRRNPPTQGSANDWGYRPQLDGLRAVAVYLVLAFHAGSWRLQGGFVGVDLFFILSGFLVTNVILGDLSGAGRLRLRRFYARRVRRLIPAAAVAIIGSSIAAVLVSNPLDRLAWSDDARAASLWYANWHFIGEANDYFRSDDATSPFQHFWSLSVEEQFYLVFPLVLIALWLLLRRNLTAITAAIAGLLVLGVIWQVTLAARDENRAYLGTDARAYQLLTGVLLALVIWRWRIPTGLRRLAPWLAPISLALLVIVASNLIEVSPSSRGLLAAIVAAACVATLQTTDGGLTSTILSWSPIRYLGQISYGTYLWHWPVTIFTLQLVDIAPLALFLVAATVGTGLAALSHELVERPIRRSPSLDRWSVPVIGVGVCVAMLGGILIAPALLHTKRQPAISQPSTEGASANLTQAVPDGIDWAAAQLAPPGAPACERPDGSDCVVTTGGSGSMLLIGDSHARMLMPTLQYIAERRDLTLSLAYSTSCPWMETSLPGGTPVGRERCIDQRQKTYDTQIEQLDPDIVVVAGYPYSLYEPGLTSTDQEVAALDAAALLGRLVTDSADALLTGGRRLVMIEPAPIFDKDPLTCLSGASTVEQCTFPPQLSTAEEELFREIASSDPNVTSVDLDPLICPRLPICDPLQHEYPVWRDENHLTTRFASFLGPLLDSQLADAGLFSDQN